MAFDRRTYMREYVARRRASWFADKSCAVCGGTERLELDHIDRATKVNSVIWTWSQVRRDAELVKCQVLCYYCHKEKTRKEVQKDFQHGEYGMYHARKCRCELCRAANAAWARKYV